MCWCRFIQAKPIDSGPFGKARRPHPAPTPSRRDPMGHFSEVFQGRHAEIADSVDESVKDVDGGPRIGKGAV